MKTNITNHIMTLGLLAIVSSVYFFNKESVGGLIFLICGVSFLYAGLRSRNTNKNIQTNGTKTKAKIIDFEEELAEDNEGFSRVHHFPIVRFMDRNGIETTQKLNSSENPKRLNELIDIIYVKKDNKYQIMIDSDYWMTFFPMTLIVGGILFSAIGVIWIISKIQIS
ncbi:DUF3592 domain-containing protein [Mangrovimonas sp. TPBH4]|uniref:DUF3592 domain-containing protein n=1 Tax=Mangrovimonas sp. TPBH4 TaxID=1645914 RepID=UPI0006B56F7D|nr:DUF3592 domain-containing protein [Mangrovimonas sp. TPBH4]